MMSLGRCFLLMGLMSGLCAAAQAESPAEAAQASYEQFKAAMQKRIAKFDAQGKSLKQVVDQLREAAGVNIVVDPKVYEKGATDLAVNLTLNNVRIESILRALLRLHNLSADYQDEILYLTTVEDEFRGQEVVTQTYDVRAAIVPRPSFTNGVIPGSLKEAELIRRKERYLFGEEDIDKILARSTTKAFTDPVEIDRRGKILVDIIKQNVASRSWRTDERVSITYNQGGSMTVTHTLPIQLQIVRLVQGMER